MGRPEHPPSTPPHSNPSKFGIRPSGVEYHDLVEQSQLTLASHRLTSQNETSNTSPPTPEMASPEPDEPLYATRWGQFTFTDLYRQTQRIAGSILVNRHGMTNPEDVDDCLQAEYLKVWQRLQKEPDWLTDKPRGYFVRAVVLHSKSQRFSHNRHYRKIVYDDEPHPVSGVTQIPQLETWLDLQKALTQVVTAIEDQPAMLLAFHSLITQTTVEEMPSSPGCASKTIYKKRPIVRRALASALRGYGSQPEETPFELNIEAQNLTSVSHHLLTDVPLYVPNARLDQDLKQLVTTAKPLERRYPTQWQERQTLEEIIMHPVVKRAAYAKAYQLGLEADDVEDCVQQGYIKLWERLKQQPDLLADKGPIWVGIFIAYSGDPKSFHRHYQKRKRFDDPDFDWDTADEHLQLGNAVNHKPEWTEAIDEQIDIAKFMHLMATHYADDTRQLLALYALTTAASTKDIASVMGIHEKNYAAAIGNRMKQAVQQHSQAFFLLPDSHHKQRD